MKSLRVRSVAAAAVLLTAGAATVQVQAAENGLQRYSPGIGGSDMTSPLVPGWYFQLPMVSYHASKMKGNDGQQATSATPLPVLQAGPGGPLARTLVDAKATNVALLPRLTYLGTDKFWGANVGLTAMLPLVRREATFHGVSTSVPGVGTIGVPAAYQSGISGQTGSEIGIGDAEVSPVLHWEIGDHQAVTFAPTLVLPTGDYKSTQRVNTGYGNFFTFRPSVQYAFIGDGWDIGARSVFSFNTRNKDTGYYSGHVFNLDYQVMAFVSDDIRVGLQGYFVRQLSGDTYDASKAATPNPRTEIIEGNKLSVNAAGPAVAWLKNGGEMLVEGKFLKEFDARNRFEGAAFWLTVSKPL